MAQLDQVINAEDLPERNDFEVIPPGNYPAMITASEMKPTKNDGEMLVLTVELQDGTNRKLFDRLNLKNKSETAVKIAYGVLGEVMKAVGKATIKDSEELHNKRFTIEVVVDPAKPYIKDGQEQPGSPQNRIKKYHLFGAVADGVAPAAASAPATAAASTTTAAPADNTPPWKRGK